MKHRPRFRVSSFVAVTGLLTVNGLLAFILYLTCDVRPHAPSAGAPFGGMELGMALIATTAGFGLLRMVVGEPPASERARRIHRARPACSTCHASRVTTVQPNVAAGATR